MIQKLREESRGKVADLIDGAAFWILATQAPKVKLIKVQY